MRGTQFTFVGVHLEVLVGESTSNSLDWHESKVGLHVNVGQGVTQGAKKLSSHHGDV
jgi:hypothetical protein